MEAALIVLHGTQRDRRIPLPETIFLLGRDPQCHLRPHCELVSKLHCAIAAWAGRVRVRDLRSRNGTFLNGRRIDGEVLVGDGDLLRIGSVAFAFRIRSQEGGPQTSAPRKDDLQWLLDSPSDEVILSPARRTVARLAPSDLGSGETAECGAADAATPTLPQPVVTKKRRTKVVSAGHHLRDYFERHQ